METASGGDELIDIVVRLPRKAVEETLLSTFNNTDAQHPRLTAAKTLVEGRRRRTTLLKGVRFYDPSWDMILELYVADRENRAFAVSQLCSLSGGSTTTALRHIEDMEALGYLRRDPDPDDRRRLLVTMCKSLGDALDKWSIFISHRCAPSLRRSHIPTKRFRAIKHENERAFVR